MARWRTLNNNRKNTEKREQSAARWEKLQSSLDPHSAEVKIRTRSQCRLEGHQRRDDVPGFDRPVCVRCGELVA